MYHKLIKTLVLALTVLCVASTLTLAQGVGGGGGGAAGGGSGVGGGGGSAGGAAAGGSGGAIGGAGQSGVGSSPGALSDDRPGMGTTRPGDMPSPSTRTGQPDTVDTPASRTETGMQPGGSAGESPAARTERSDERVTGSTPVGMMTTTVESADAVTGIIRLRTTDGKVLQFKTSPEHVRDLQRGDSVEVRRQGNSTELTMRGARSGQ
jgi:hypothetical protein